MGSYKEGLVKSMLEFLFSSEITFPGSWKAENRFGKELDEIIKLQTEIQAKLGEEQSGLWQAYQEQARQLENRQCRMEFERGFLSAANLALEIICRTAEGSE